MFANINTSYRYLLRLRPKPHQRVAQRDLAIDQRQALLAPLVHGRVAEARDHRELPEIEKCPQLGEPVDFLVGKFWFHGILGPRRGQTRP